MVKISDKRRTIESSSLLSFLKVMYFTGFLPIKWTSCDVHDKPDIFEISWLKTTLMIILDFFVALTIPAYLFFWHWLNIDSFDLHQLLTAKFYLEVNDGIVTTTLCQFVYITYPCCIFWIYGTVGKLFIISKCSSNKVDYQVPFLEWGLGIVKM